jgi:hypothetical protein
MIKKGLTRFQGQKSSRSWKTAAFSDGSAELVYAPGEPDPGRQAGVLD